MTDARRWAEYLPVGDLVPAPRNAKGHAIPELRASFERFGAIEPCVLDERTGKLLSGHGRTQVLTELEAVGDQPPEGVVVGDDGRWQWLVVRGVHSKDDAHAEAMVVALNQLTIRGGWQQDLLAESLDALRAADLLDVTGFDSDYLDDLVHSLSPPPDLDDLARDLGDSDPADFWPVLRFKVPPALRGRYLALVATVPGGDADQFGWLVDQAEQAQAVR